MKIFKNVTIVIAKIIIVLLIIVPIVFFISALLCEYSFHPDVIDPKVQTLIVKFNEKFTPYEGDKITATQIKSLFSSVKSNNENHSEMPIVTINSLVPSSLINLTDTKKYQVSLEFSNNGYINNIIIQDAKGKYIEVVGKTKEELNIKDDDFNVQTNNIPNNPRVDFKDAIKDLAKAIIEDDLLPFLSFIVCYILIFINIIIIQKSKTGNNKSKQIWLNLSLMAVVSIIMCVYGLLFSPIYSPGHTTNLHM